MDKQLLNTDLRVSPKGDLKYLEGPESVLEKGVVQVGGSAASGLLFGGAVAGIAGAIVGSCLGLAAGLSVFTRENREERKNR